MVFNMTLKVKSYNFLGLIDEWMIMGGGGVVCQNGMSGSLCSMWSFIWYHASKAAPIGKADFCSSLS